MGRSPSRDSAEYAEKLSWIPSDGIHYINIATLVELKLASGMTNLGRLKDLSDVLELIKAIDLPFDFGDQLNAFVRDKYQELWKQARKRFVTIWRSKELAAEAKTIEDMIAMLRSAADELERMRQDGVMVDDASQISAGHVRLVTTDPIIAEKYGFVDESEYWDMDGDEAT
ncbi:MAG: hypothetical protein KDA59_11520 [Planctomycetales bacterium]|nr:hypothetical protein [Planctomycetales bacterium]